MGTTTFKRSLLVDTSLMGVVTDLLGTNATDYDDSELGKGVVLGADAYVAAAKAGEIEGIVNSVESGTRNAGFSWGGIQTKGRAEAVVGASQTPAIAVGEIVINDTPIADGTEGKIQVFGTGTGFVAPSSFIWRVISLGAVGTGAVGTTVIIERV